MRAAIRLIMIVVGLTLLGVAVGAVVFRGQVERLARERLQERLGHVVESEVRIEAIRPAPLEYGVALVGVEVDNPAAFKAGPAIRCGRILLRPDWRTIFNKTLTLEQILVEDAEIHLRHELGQGTNLGALAQQAARLSEAQQQGRMVIVREFACKEAKMRLTSNLTPAPIPMTLSPFKLGEIREGRPVSTAKLTAVFLRSLVVETLTLKGLLRPVVDLLGNEVKTLPLE